MTKKYVSILLTSFAVLLLHGEVLAAKTAQDTLIEKLSGIYQNLAPSNPTRASIVQRLADLHSERARRLFKEELEAGCSNNCNAGAADRKKALSLYKSILNKVDAEKKGKILVQMGHLNELMGQSAEAEKIYTNLSKTGKGSQAVEAHYSKAEILFKRGQYQKAVTHYQKVMSADGAKNRGMASYRMAWCQFNGGQVQKAKGTLKSLLKDPSRLRRMSGGRTGVVDPEFQQQVVKDLATFMGKTGISLAEAKEMESLSAPEQKLSNLSYLAGELERLGKEKDSIAVYSYLAEKQADVFERLKSYAVLSDLLMKRKQLKSSLDYYEKALGSWELAQGKCEPSECKEVKVRLKNYLVTWNKSEKKKPSDLLVKAYGKYLETFSGESDVLAWSIAASKLRKEWAQAMSAQDQLIALYSQGASANAKKLEQALLFQIELAELSKDTSAHKKYLALYSDRSQLKTQGAAVEYQQAKLAYDNKEYKKAATEFYAIAKNKEAGDQKLRVKAANLSLDTLVLLKDDLRLEQWSKELALMFPSERANFSKISLRSILTQTQKKSQGNGEMEEAWATLNRAQLQGATAEDKLTYYKNKISLAELLGKFTEARVAVNDLLRLKPLSAADRKFALEKKIWFSELNLDFATALSSLQSLGVPKKKSEKTAHYLKVAILSELAKQPSEKHYQTYLKLAGQEEAIAIVQKLLKGSKNLKADIKRYKKWLAKKPELLSYWQFLAYSQTPSLKYARTTVKQSRNKKTAGIRLLQRELLLDDLKKHQAALTKHQFRKNNQNRLARDIKKRVSLIGKAEKLAGRAIDSQDWVTQLVALSVLRDANKRMEQDLLSLPVPAELTPEQRQQYSEAIASQAAQYQTKNEELQVKITEFFSGPGQNQVFEETKDQPASVQRQILSQLKAIDELNPQATVVSTVESLYNSHKVDAAEKVSPTEIESLKKLVRQQPLSVDPLERLIQFEKQRDPNSEMFNYLMARKDKIKALGVQ